MMVQTLKVWSDLRKGAGAVVKFLHRQAGVSEKTLGPWFSENRGPKVFSRLA